MAVYYPPVGFHFLVEFIGLGVGDSDIRFQSVSGLNVDLQTESRREGGENRFEHALPVMTKYPNLVLKRGYLKDSAVIAWCLNTFNNLEVVPTDILISLLNEEHEPLQSWNVVRAWPLKWSVSEFNAEQNNLVVETFELKYNYFELV